MCPRETDGHTPGYLFCICLPASCDSDYARDDVYANVNDDETGWRYVGHDGVERSRSVVCLLENFPSTSRGEIWNARGATNHRFFAVGLFS